VKKYLVLIATALCVTCGASFAQDGAMNGGAIPVVSQASIEAARDLLLAMQTREAMLASMKQTAKAWAEQTRNLVNSRIQNQPGSSAKEKQIALTRLEEMLPRMEQEALAAYADPDAIDEYIAGLAALYARMYTLDELHQLVVFHKSPVGQKMAASNPKLMVEMSNLHAMVLAPGLNRLALKMSRDFKLD
jgi:hypothetical protein